MALESFPLNKQVHVRTKGCVEIGSVARRRVRLHQTEAPKKPVRSTLAGSDNYPLTEEHTLVVRTEHVGSIFDLSLSGQHDLWSLVAEVRAALARDLGVSAFNIGLNDGSAAGQTIDHAHIHVIPRRWGDVRDPRGDVRCGREHQCGYAGCVQIANWAYAQDIAIRSHSPGISVTGH